MHFMEIHYFLGLGWFFWEALLGIECINFIVKNRTIELIICQKNECLAGYITVSKVYCS